MKIQEMRLLSVLAEELHFGRAAERIGMAQPQLSDSIRRIESEAGVTIFTRRPAVRLTPGGEVIVAMARRLLAELEAGTKRARAVAAGMIGHVSVGFSPMSMCSDLPEITRDFLRENEGVDLEFFEGTTEPLNRRLERGELDLVIGRTPLWGEGFDNLVFARDQVVLGLPEGHPAAAEDPVKPASVTGEDFILFARSSAPHYFDRINAWCGDIGLEPVVVRETDSWIASIGMVRAGLGLTLGTELLSRLVYPGVVYRRIDAERLDVSFWMSWMPARISPATQRFIDFVKARRGQGT